MGWLRDFTDWLLDLVRDIWQAVVDFFNDLILFTVEALLDLFAMIVESIPAPDFLDSYSMAGLMGDAGPTVGWIAGEFMIFEGLAILGAAYAFRMTRKLLTLGQW